MVQKIIKTGNSLAVTIPSRFVKLAGIKAGDSVKVIIETAKGRIIYFFSGAKQLTISETLSKDR